MANPLEDAAKSVASNLPKQEGYSFDYTIIIDLIVSLISGCLKNRSPEQVAKSLGRLGVVERFALRRACRSAADETGYDFRDLVQACEKAAEGATDDQRLDCCKAVAAQSGMAV